MLAGSFLVALLMMVLVGGMFVLWLASLVHCARHRREPDRMLWVIIAAFGGPIGSILYLAMGRSAPGQLQSPPPMAGAMSDVLPSVARHDFDHRAMQDERKRAQAITESLAKAAASKRQQ